MIDDDPYDYEDDLEDECFHEEYEIDILTGIASCDHCGHRWMISRKDLEREHQLQVEYDREMARLEAEGFSIDDDDGRRLAVCDDEIPF